MKHASAALTLLVVSGCSAILGIEDVPDPSGGGATGVSATGITGSVAPSATGTTSSSSTGASGTGGAAPFCGLGSTVVAAEPMVFDDQGGSLMFFASARPAPPDGANDVIFLHGANPEFVLFRGTRPSNVPGDPFSLESFAPTAGATPLNAPQDPLFFDEGLYFTGRLGSGVRRMYFLAGADGVEVASDALTGVDTSVDAFFPYAVRGEDGATVLFFSTGAPTRIHRVTSVAVGEHLAFDGDTTIQIEGVTDDVARPVVLADQSLLYFRFSTQQNDVLHRAQRSGPSAFNGLESVPIPGVDCAVDPLWVSPDGCTVWFQCAGPMPGPYVATLIPAP